MERLAVLKDAEQLLLEAFAGAGVVRIDYVVGFLEVYEVRIWLGIKPGR